MITHTEEFVWQLEMLDPRHVSLPYFKNEGHQLYLSDAGCCFFEFLSRGSSFLPIASCHPSCIGTLQSLRVMRAGRGFVNGWAATLSLFGGLVADLESSAYASTLLAADPPNTTLHTMLGSLSVVLRCPKCSPQTPVIRICPPFSRIIVPDCVLCKWTPEKAI
jgi:hypothetical protein